MVKQHVVRLTEAERHQLHEMLRGGTAPARRLTRARILLKADAGGEGPRWIDAHIAQALEISVRTVARVRSEWASGGVDRVLNGAPSRRRYARKLDDAATVHLTRLACSTPPPGHQRWSLRLLAETLVELEIVEAIAPETVRLALKKTSSNRGARSAGAS